MSELYGGKVIAAGFEEIVNRLKDLMVPDDTALLLMPSGNESDVHKVSAKAMRVVLMSGGAAIEPGQGKLACAAEGEGESDG